MTPIPITRKPSDQTCDSINQKRNKAAKQLVYFTILRDRKWCIQTTALIKSFDYEERQKNYERVGFSSCGTSKSYCCYESKPEPSMVPTKTSRWLKTFDIKMSSEKEARKIGEKM